VNEQEALELNSTYMRLVSHYLVGDKRVIMILVPGRDFGALFKARVKVPIRGTLIKIMCRSSFIIGKQVETMQNGGFSATTQIMYQLSFVIRKSIMWHMS
jgi:hypothetical protein